MGAEASGTEDDARRDLALLTDAVREAGRRALSFSRGHVRRWTKADGTPVSEADVAVDEALSAALRAARPSYGWVSEEIGGAPSSARAFVVDPIDGTRAFLAGEDGWTVVAAVVEAGRPRAAAVYRPVRDQLYAAVLGGGATLNGVPLAVSPQAALSGAKVAMPRGLFDEAGFRGAGVRRGGWISSLALRLCRVAAGSPDAVVTRSGPHHWDLAAADLVLHEAGGRLTTLSGDAPRYDTARTAHGPVVGGSSALAEALRRMAAGHGATPAS